MKMNLKNKSIRKIKISRIKLTSKNLFIFLISFSIITLIVGMLFYYFLNNGDKDLAQSSVTNIFGIKESYDYLNLLKTSLLQNSFSTFLIWILGISVIGVIATIFIYFCEVFSIGFTIASIFGEYGVKGILASFCYLIPSKICYLIIIFLLTFFAIKISYKIIKLCFTNEDVKIKEEIRKYFKVLLFSFIAMIAISLMEVFIDPFLIKLFTSV